MGSSQQAWEDLYKEVLASKAFPDNVQGSLEIALWKLSSELIHTILKAFSFEFGGSHRHLELTLVDKVSAYSKPQIRVRVSQSIQEELEDPPDSGSPSVVPFPAGAAPGNLSEIQDSDCQIRTLGWGPRIPPGDSDVYLSFKTTAVVKSL